MADPYSFQSGPDPNAPAQPQQPQTVADLIASLPYNNTYMGSPPGQGSADLMKAMPSGVPTIGYPAIGAGVARGTPPPGEGPGGGLYGDQWVGQRTPGLPNVATGYTPPIIPTVRGYPAQVGPTMDPDRPGYFAGPIFQNTRLTPPSSTGSMAAMLSPGGGTGVANPAQIPTRWPTPPPRPMHHVVQHPASSRFNRARAQAPVAGPPQWSGPGSVLRLGPGGGRGGASQQMVSLPPSSMNVLNALFGGRR